MSHHHHRILVWFSQYLCQEVSHDVAASSQKILSGLVPAPYDNTVTSISQLKSADTIKHKSTRKSKRSPHLTATQLPMSLCSSFKNSALAFRGFVLSCCHGPSSIPREIPILLCTPTMGQNMSTGRY
ncbi:hypothetical protein TGAM01_v201116 [Trichoderma gamsii]|uniref:Uncharacterized protein n=1 Tax=Trichoderma gamsii TaxID=398673 RepID=A0A2P4ZZM2_9HYPO|nr:hypothetical protein TGAM01_v201116 [Trichoderma gamsii]PON29750.1 hypothetical protein TGAM01_v201116 [Trichoderma gamsii]